MSSREIIWKHAFDYGWLRRPNAGMDPNCDMFIAPAPEGLRETLLVVYYATNGRVLDIFRNGQRLEQSNRDAVMDLIEERASRSGVGRG